MKYSFGEDDKCFPKFKNFGAIGKKIKTCIVLFFLDLVTLGKGVEIVQVFQLRGKKSKLRLKSENEVFRYSDHFLL